MDNDKEYEQAGALSQKDVSEIYDAKHGKYKDVEPTSPSSKPLDTSPTPFKISK
jgi:uncharacterized surface anchored protein